MEKLMLLMLALAIINMKKKRRINMDALVDSLVKERKRTKEFTITEAAFKCGVSEQTVRNFEKGSCINSTVLLYYLMKLRLLNGGDYDEEETEFDLSRALFVTNFLGDVKSLF